MGPNDNPQDPNGAPAADPNAPVVPTGDQGGVGTPAGTPAPEPTTPEPTPAPTENPTGEQPGGTGNTGTPGM